MAFHLFGKKRKEQTVPEKIPAHVAFIMDGNGRWAKKRGLPRTAGHRAGVITIRRVIRHCCDRGVKAVTFYAFSTENWSRPQQEVDTLMDLFVEFIDSEIDELDAQGARVRIIGRRQGLSERVMASIEKAQTRTQNNERIFVNIAFNYGGRAEIAEAVQRMMRDGIGPDEVSETMIGDYLYTAGQPDPDLVVRTSGEQRISNFLLYQSAYAEYLFPEILWPDVDEEALDGFFAAYAKRDRRFGNAKE